jgi:hypothetical protein
MLGTLGSTQPQLLVEISDSKTDFTRFHFVVINGGWEGLFEVFYPVSNNVMRVFAPDGTDVYTDQIILCDNQDRLRGDYQSVFNNYYNPHYVAPECKNHKRYILPDLSDMDDDIPF